MYPYYYVNAYPVFNPVPFSGWNRSIDPYIYTDGWHQFYPAAPATERKMMAQDYGQQPFVTDIEKAAEENDYFRTALWTGKHLQVTLMSIRPGEDIGLEVHRNVDQFLRIEDGHGLVQMGNAQNNLLFQKNVSEDDAIMVPAGTWHNVTNTGNEALKLYSIYAPPEHPFGTIHRTKEEAKMQEH
ncbi:cupin domain-containing protein [Virgibacillus halophilus]|uniref:Cupin domain-containing protein n=1 Tax=Tigheibacillus halophilus TaxID=361280 RepID=A0ABU5C940_9BACI|nr:cupin domain-containing protein [Virgibacillus halophilus]